ncbi:LuxE/PaaK family acyltransferase [Marinicrinis sediminis]|uniref:Acyl-protein synthetase LuxE domain-containing protein n=1 Tax=Marinicrinis sediminis TaxID=1652465 RepID=A0ABW5RB29_9BACL
MSIHDCLMEQVRPYEMEQAEKETYLLKEFRHLLQWHVQHCKPYRHLVEAQARDGQYAALTDLPFLPTSIFKEFELKTAANKDVKMKTVQSSSTSSGVPSQVFIDERTSARQRQSLQAIWNDHIGVERRPYIIFDTMQTARGKQVMSARGAAIMSLMGYASEFHFVMDDIHGELRLNPERFEQALQAAREAGQFIAYGFTYLLHQAHEQLMTLYEAQKGFDSQTFLIHSGGWKRLEHMRVHKETFNQQISQFWGIEPSQVIDFYGLVEQTGVVYPDCSAGNKHVPYFADVIIRAPHTLKPLPVGETGLIQLISLLPLSSPNFSVLTDDLGEWVGTDECPCGRKGKAFRFKGRAPKAEARGCGDVYAEEIMGADTKLHAK